MKIIERKQMILAGFSFYGDPFNSKAGWTEENEIGILWKRFMNLLYEKNSPIAHLKDNREWFEVWIESEESSTKGFFEIFVGIEVKNLENIPHIMLLKILPECRYAVYTAKGEAIKSDEPYISFQNWLKESKSKQSHNFSIQVYDERFKGMDKISESELDFYFPIK